MSTRMFASFALAAGLALTACQDAANSPDPTDPVSPDINAAVTPAGLTTYIMTFTPGEADPEDIASGIANAHAGNVRHIYRHALRGAAIRLPDAAIEGIRNNPNVDSIRPELQGQFSDVAQIGNATWGIDRADQRDLPLNQIYIPLWSGFKTTIYVIDSGIANHDDFGSRVIHVQPITGGTGIDCNGHGTHVAGSAAGTTHGIARNAKIVAVKVSPGCGGDLDESDVVMGVDWVTANASGPSVANMSIAFPQSGFLDLAVWNSINSGVVYTVAAGNDDTDACNFSPARQSLAITVAASTITDARADFSNWGTCVDIFAPGDSITSASHLNPGAFVHRSGTSMAAPHVAGAAALYLDENPTAGTGSVANAIVNSASKNKISDVISSPNLLLYSHDIDLTGMNLSGSVSGPSIVWQKASYTWAANASGAEGGGSYTYQWEVKYLDTGQVFPLGTGQSQSLTVFGSDGDLQMRVTIRSGDEDILRTRTVSNCIWASSGCGA